MGERTLDVLVTCQPHDEHVTLFPQVRGHYLAHHLARSGLRAEFHHLPATGMSAEVVICSEYQQDMAWIGTFLEPALPSIGADRLFCMADFSLAERADHFSRPYCEWFGARGGVLCHLGGDVLLPYEHWIGLGIDAEVVHPDPTGRRDHVLFDFPLRSPPPDPATIAAVRTAAPALRVVGSGPAETPGEDLFDEWITYGQPHRAYVEAAFPGAVAYVLGCAESLGLPIAEAQVAGGCIVSSEYQVQPAMLVAEADLPYEAGDRASLAAAIGESGHRDHDLIRRQAQERFDFRAVVARTREAIGL